MTSNGSPDKWIVPAGGVENGEQYDEAAVREALEEVSWSNFKLKQTLKPISMKRHKLNSAVSMGKFSHILS